LQLNYREITLSDREWMNKHFDMTARGSLEYSFTTSFLWRCIYNFRVAEYQGYMLLLADPKNPTFLFPCGQGPLEPVIEALINDAAEMGAPLTFNTVLPEDKARLEAMYPGKFSFELYRDGADYVYDMQSLATLKGKKLAAKRNHIHRFVENHPDWQYEPISEANMEEVRQMKIAWCHQAGCRENSGLADEYCAVEQAFRNFRELKLDGGLIRAEGKVVAFSMGDKLNDTTYLVHFEKAFPEIQGAYPMINQQFVMNNCQNYAFVNREEDTGEPGLRQAKLSYNPSYLVEKYIATYQAGEEQK